jgi:transcription elongation factor Elf1
VNEPSPKYFTCPFCDDGDFDKVGLKHHLLNGYCETFNSTMSVEEERNLNKIKHDSEGKHDQ